VTRVRNQITPAYTANTTYASKLAYFSTSHSGINTLFFGSSLTYRQVNPQIIDSSLRDYKLSSFNFGSEGTYTPESLLLADKLLENEALSSGIKYIFVELTNPFPITLLNGCAARSYYYFDFDYLKFAYHYYHLNKKLNFRRVKLAGLFIQGYLLNLFFPGIPITNSSTNIVLGANHDGFFPLEQAQLMSKKENFKARHQQFLNDTTVIHKRKPMVQNLSKDYTALLDGMILKFGEKKVELFFIVPYMADNQFPLVDTNRVIYLYDPVSNPGKYMAHDFFDHAHLNQAGANLNSVQISAEIRKKFRDSHILPVI